MLILSSVCYEVSQSNCFMVIYLFNVYIPWIIRDKSHLDIGIVNTDMDATR
jgi:hypothetical protein